MSSDLIPLQRLRSLEFWPGPIDVEPLPGGITNRNFRVRSGGRTYVARLSAGRPLLGIDRRNEVVCQRAAHGLGVAPEVLHHEDGVLISAHLDARTMDAESVRDPAFVPRLARVLRRLHEPWDTLSGEMLYFSAWQAVRTYAERVRALAAEVPADLGALLDDARALAREIGPFTPALCHNDLLPANILDDGREVRLVDWEYAGMGHPLFDLAGVAGNCGFDESLEVALLEAYRGRCEPRDLRELRVLKTLSLLREGLWAAIQTVSSELAFDYRGYADDNFRAYRAARDALGGR